MCECYAAICFTFTFSNWISAAVGPWYCGGILSLGRQPHLLLPVFPMRKVAIQYSDTIILLNFPQETTLQSPGTKGGRKC